MRGVLLAILLSLTVAGCSRSRSYELEGQVLAVDLQKRELTVRHKDIKGFMPGMTMPFKVGDGVALQERKPGELIRARLVVTDSLGILEDVVRTGDAPLPADAAAAAHKPILDTGATVPDAAFVDQDARPRRLADWRGRTLAVTFVYTRCPLPDFCPLMDKNFAAVQRSLLQDPALAERVHLVSVSFDPDHDTPAVLRAHAQKVGTDFARWTWVTGSRDAIEPFASAFGVSLFREDGAGTEIIHNLRTAVIDRDGRLTRIFNGNEWKPEELLAALRAADGR